jgi:beta-propeller uncharacterized protein DUF5122
VPAFGGERANEIFRQPGDFSAERWGMKTKSIVYGMFLVANFVACSGEFKVRPACGPAETEDAEGKCQSAGAAGVGGTGGAGDQGGQSGGPSGGGGIATTGTPVLQVPPRRVGLRRARALDVTIGLQQAVGVDLSVTVEGLPAYMSAEPLTLPAGTISGVLTMRATNEAPLGVPSQVRVRAVGTAQPAEANLEAWVMGEPGTLDETFGEGGSTVGFEMVNVVGIVPLLDGSAIAIGNLSKKVGMVHYFADGKIDPFFRDPSPGSGAVRSYAPPGSSTNIKSDYLETRAVTALSDGNYIIFSIRTQLAEPPSGSTPLVKGYRWHVSRHLPNGDLDVSFGEGGALSLGDDVAASSTPTTRRISSPLGGIAIAPDGSIVIAAQDSSDPSSPCRLTRLTASGSLDQNFGSSGFVRSPTLACRPTSVAVFPDGSLAVGGYKADPQGREQACVARFQRAFRVQPVAAAG